MDLGFEVGLAGAHRAMRIATPWGTDQAGGTSPSMHSSCKPFRIVRFCRCLRLVLVLFGVSLGGPTILSQRILGDLLLLDLGLYLARAFRCAILGIKRFCAPQLPLRMALLS